jgi:hypothetical protein
MSTSSDTTSTASFCAKCASLATASPISLPVGRRFQTLISAHDERIWPILVTADIAQMEPLHDLFEAALPEVYDDTRVQSLLVGDPEDELLMGMVEGGASLTGILERRQSGLYAKLELKRWVFCDPASPGERRPSFALERWERVTTSVREVLQVEE